MTRGTRLRGSNRVRCHRRHRCTHFHSRGTGHEGVRALRRCHLPYLLHLRTRPRRALGDVPVARLGAKVAQREWAVVSAARRVEKRLKDVDNELEHFFRAIGPLSDKTLALLVQLPPSLQIHEGLERLRDVVRRLDSRFRYAVEVRHSSWFQELAADLNLIPIA